MYEQMSRRRRRSNNTCQLCDVRSLPLFAAERARKFEIRRRRMRE